MIPLTTRAVSVYLNYHEVRVGALSFQHPSRRTNIQPTASNLRPGNEFRANLITALFGEKSPHLEVVLPYWRYTRRQLVNSQLARPRASRLW